MLKFDTAIIEMKLKGLVRIAKTGMFHYQAPMVKGIRPERISLKTKDFKTARRRWEDVSEVAALDYKGGSLRMESERWLREKRANLQHTAASSENSGGVIRRLITYLENMDTGAVRRRHIEGFRDQLAGRNVSPATIKTEIGRIRGFFTWAVADGIIERNPCNGVELPRQVPTRSEKYCTKDEREKLIQTLPDDRPDLEAVYWIGFFAGLRKMEIIEARRDWVDLSGGVLTVRNTDTFTTKDKQHRFIRISERLGDFLAEYLRNNPAGDSPYLIRPDRLPGKKSHQHGTNAWRYRFDPRRSFKTHARNQGLDWVTFHTMRHTFATLHAMAGTPLTTIARELGDDAEVTFRNYIGYTRHSGHANAAD